MSNKFSLKKCCCTKCSCFTGIPTGISISPTIYKPFTGPFSSRNSGSTWYNPSYIYPSRADFFNSSHTHSVLDTTTPRSITSDIASTFLFGSSSTEQKNSYQLALSAGVDIFSSSALIASRSTTPGVSNVFNNFPCQATQLDNAYEQGNYYNSFIKYTNGSSLTNYYPDYVGCCTLDSSSELLFPYVGSCNNVLCYKSHIKHTGFGTNYYHWGNPGDNTNYGTYLFSTRPNDPLAENRNFSYETVICMWAWFGRDTRPIVVPPSNYEYVDDTNDGCRLHIILSTYTAWYRDGSYADYTNNDIFALGRSTWNNYNAHWQSDVITAKTLSSVPTNIDCSLVEHTNSMKTSFSYYFGTEGYWSLLYPIYLYKHGLSIRPDSTITATVIV